MDGRVTPSKSKSPTRASQDEPPPLLLGAHISIAGGLDKAIPRAEKLGCTAIQIFTKNAMQWKGRVPTAEEVKNFKEARCRAGMLVVAHAAYLINFATPDKELRKKSITALIAEAETAEELGLPYLIFHPGSHRGSGEDVGIRAVIDSLNRVLKSTAGYGVRILVENTAGQGASIGRSFEQLQRLVNGGAEPERVGMCLDSCHAFAAGYDISHASGYKAVTDELDRLVGFDRLAVLHLNDSKRGLGSRVDRHEHIGKGAIGLDFFRLAMNDSRLRGLPKLIETPKIVGGIDMDVENLTLLRNIVKNDPE